MFRLERHLEQAGQEREELSRRLDEERVEHATALQQATAQTAAERARVEDLHHQVKAATADLARLQGQLVEREPLLAMLKDRVEWALGTAAAVTAPPRRRKPPKSGNDTK